MIRTVFWLVAGSALLLIAGPVWADSTSTVYSCVCEQPTFKCTEYQTQSEASKNCASDCTAKDIACPAPAGQPAASSGGGPADDKMISLENPLASGVTSAPTIIGYIIKGLMGIIGAVVLLMFVWGAGAWLLSAGNPEKIKAGAMTMLWAVIGAVIVFVSYIYLSTVMKLLAGQL